MSPVTYSLLPTVLTYVFGFLGHCLKGPLCQYVHNPATVAICKEYLQKGSCPAGQSCDLSHESTPERTPACLHFLRGHCSNPICRYTHVRVNPSARVCKDFAVYGYCGKGLLCNERHVHECPSYANRGTCRDTKCRLPHVDRAGQIRQRASNGLSTNDTIDTTNPLESGTSPAREEKQIDCTDSDDVDSDNIQQDSMDGPIGHQAHALFQQQDYVHF